MTTAKKKGTALAKKLKTAKKQRTAAEMGSRPVQETDTGLGGMMSGGPTTRRKKPSVKRKSKKY